MEVIFQNVGRQWGQKRALEAASLVINPGERVALIGPSGGGKSTLLKLLNGVLKPTSGQVVVDGIDLNTLSLKLLRQHRSRCAIVTQGAQLVPQLSVHKNITAGALPHWPWYKVFASFLFAFEKDSTAKLLKHFGMAERQWERVSVLSGGEQQRVAVARALVSKGDILLADEPTAALDPTTATTVLNRIVAYADDGNKTLVISTHWVSGVRDVVDRLLGIRQGRLVFDKPAQEVSNTDLESLYAGSGERR